MVEIDKGVPLPERGPPAPVKYPVVDMEVGDSFLHPGPAGSARSLCSGVSRLRNLGFKFRYAPEGTGTRVWRRA